MDLGNPDPPVMLLLGLERSQLLPVITANMQLRSGLIYKMPLIVFRGGLFARH